MTSEHTPLPWYVDDEGNIWDSDSCPSIIGKMDIATEACQANAALFNKVFGREAPKLDPDMPAQHINLTLHDLDLGDAYAKGFVAGKNARARRTLSTPPQPTTKEE